MSQTRLAPSMRSAGTSSGGYLPTALKRRLDLDRPEQEGYESNLFVPPLGGLQSLIQASSTAAVSGGNSPIEFAATYSVPLILSEQPDAENVIRFLRRNLVDWKSAGEFAFSDKSEFGELPSRGQHAVYRLQVEFDASATKHWEAVLERLRVASPLRGLLQATKNRVRAFTNLEENWDSYGAVHIAYDTITSALDLVDKLAVILSGRYSNIQEPFVTPCPDGGIQFEWDNDGRELEIIVPTDRLPLRYFHVQGDEEGSGIISSDTQLRSLMGWLVGATA